MTVYEWSMYFLAHGIATIPIRFRDKRPKLKTWEKYKKTLPDIEKITEWFLGGSFHNYGVVMNWENLAVFDFDNMSSFYEWQAWTFGLPKGHPAAELADFAYYVRTSRGFHIYFKMLESGQNAHVNGLDIKRNGYVIGAGSVHPSGTEYKGSKEFYLPIIKTLDDLLPESWLEKLRHPPEPEVEIQNRVTFSSDPFDMASNPIDTEKDIIPQIKKRVPLLSLFSDAQSTGRGYYMAKCPFHDDSNPSFWIDTKRGICNCNKCNFPLPLDVIGVYAKMHGISNRESIRRLSEVA